MNSAKTRLPILVIIVLMSIACVCGFTDYDHDKHDTPANQAGFERHFGFPPPASVTNLYYYADEMGADVTYQLGFTTDLQTIDKIVSALGLTQEGPTPDCTYIIREFDWWKEDAIRDLTAYWKSNSTEDYYWLLWFDATNGRAYYLEFSI